MKQRNHINACILACSGILTAQLQPGSVKALVEALEGIVGLMDDGSLVRNISKDHEPGWAFKQIGFVKTLAHAALALAPFKETGK